MRLLRLGIMLLPIALVFGVAAQALGLYAFGFLLPTVALFSSRMCRDSQLPLVRLSLLLFALYIVFPLANIWNIPKFFGPTAIIDTGLTELPWRKLLTSQITSGVLFSGVALAVLGGLALRRKRLGHHADAGKESGVLRADVSRQILQWFVMGALAASAVLTGFVVHEFVTGTPWRPFTSTPMTHPAGYGLFRTYGFYGGPLHLAGAALAWLAMFWLLFWKWVEVSVAEYTNHAVSHPWLVRLVANRRWATGAALFAISAMQIVHILMAGGRTAIAVAFLILGLTPFLAKLRSPWRRTRLIGSFAMLGLVFAGTLASGLGTRFADVLTGPIERFTIWKIHWDLFSTDFLFGTGHFWVKQILEGQSYESLRATGMPLANTHNVFLAAASEVGLVGSVWIVAAMVGLAYLLWSRSQNRPAARLLVKGLFLALGANALHGFTENTFFTSNVTYIYLGFFWVTVWVMMTEKAPLMLAGRRGGGAEDSLRESSDFQPLSVGGEEGFKGGKVAAFSRF